MGFFDLFGKKDGVVESLPKNDVERWVTDTYAMWSEYCGGVWKYIGGYQKNRSNASMMRGVLRRDWEISNHDDGVEMVEYLMLDKEDAQEEKIAGWDYCRACQLLGMFYVAGYMEREEVINLSKKACKVIQKKFSSWDELCQSYIEGYSQWRREVDSEFGGGMETDIQERNDIYQRLCQMEDGTYKLDWNLSL